MNKRNKRIIISVIGALVGTSFLYTHLDPKAEDVQYVTAYQLKADVKTNKKIEPADLEKVNVNAKEVKDWMIRDEKDAIGKYAKVDMYAGEKIRKERLANKEVIKFEPNERTMNLDVSLTRMGGLPKIGDHVDVVVYYGANDNEIGLSKLVLEDVTIVRVLTKDGRDVVEATPDNKDTRTTIPAIVTVKVTVDQAVQLNTWTSTDKAKIRLLGRTSDSKIIQ